MNAFTPHCAPVVVMLFLGSAGLIGLSLVILLSAAITRSRVAAAIAVGLLLTVAGGYCFLLFGSSLISHDTVLPRGAWKYFCEIDCHIAYSIAEVHTAAALGPEADPTNAKGEFVIVRVSAWFDQNTISPHRGDSPLRTGNRTIALRDENGVSYKPSATGEAALRSREGPPAPLDQPLRPGESFTTTFVFDVPQGTHTFRLLIGDPPSDWPARFLVGHETSFFHKKIYLATYPLA